jgi:hypothetical protein
VIAWTSPAALWALLLAAAPVIVHLLRRHRAARVPFPSLRFVRQAETSAVRLRRPDDPWLLLLRVAAIACAAGAAAGPILVTSTRLAEWNAVTARAIVVDTSESMGVADAGGAVPARLADEAAQAEARSAAYSTRIDASSLADGVRRAAAWTVSAPPARREVVVITDAQHGALDAGTLADVPDGTGVRVVAVGRRSGDRVVDGAPLVESAGRARRQRVTLSADATSVAIAGVQDTAGVRILTDGPEASGAIARLLDVAGRAGSFAPSADQSIAFGFTGTATEELPVSPLRGGWMLSTALGVMADRRLASIAGADASPLDDRFGRAPWTPLLVGNGKPLLSAAALQKDLVLRADTALDSVFAAAVIQSALNARAGATSYDEREVATTAPAVLATWQRPAAPVGRDVWRQAQTTDARWCWALALLALAIEQWLRGRSRRRSGGMGEDVRVAA